ncbi:4-(cytidine 5'-diphospho)-2-C-methyl-D-erythritol kinase [Corynebacterium mayonis]|uniref:4-(cytidine 5'-diphospho)-2-C-methyl-D-erythritol kinase n=1 Tax=Corynebacterium mayonis TaxID=3062461 RepID=UPI0031403E57
MNLHLGVGDARRDGYHDLLTVFQAVQRRERVTLKVERGGSGGVVTSMSTSFAVAEPEENINTAANLAWRAVEAVVEDAGVDVPAVRIHVDKRVFVAGGMAGGSADAAAALVAAAEFVAHYGGVEVDFHALHRLAAGLGADVPFCLMGGTAQGTGRGDELVAMISRGTFHWVFVNPRVGLPTGRAFTLLDDLRHNDPALVARLDTTALSRALLSGDPEQVAGALHNDLQAPAVRMRPQLLAVLEEGSRVGLAAIVSGSGPTVAVLCRDGEHAQQAEAQLRALFPDYEAFRTTGPAEGARLD